MARWCYRTVSSILLLNADSAVTPLSLALPGILALWKFDWWLIDSGEKEEGGNGGEHHHCRWNAVAPATERAGRERKRERPWLKKAGHSKGDIEEEWGRKPRRGHSQNNAQAAAASSIGVPEQVRSSLKDEATSACWGWWWWPWWLHRNLWYLLCCGVTWNCCRGCLWPVSKMASFILHWVYWQGPFYLFPLPVTQVLLYWVHKDLLYTIVKLYFSIHSGGRLFVFGKELNLV